MMENELLSDKIFTVSNIITVSRAFFLPFFVHFASLFHENTNSIVYYYILIFICILVVLSDYLDGLVARLLKEETILGRYLDPVSDKIVTIGGLSTITAYFNFPLWILSLFILREIIGVWFGLYLYFKKGIQGKPNLWGKWAVALVAICVIHYLSIPLLRVHFTDFFLTNYPEVTGILLIVVVFIGSMQYISDYKEYFYN